MAASIETSDVAVAATHSESGWPDRLRADRVRTLIEATVAVDRYLTALRNTRLNPTEPVVAARQAALDAEFVQAAAVFGKAHGIEYGTWRELGVDISLLRQAGIAPRHRSRPLGN